MLKLLNHKTYVEVLPNRKKRKGNMTKKRLILKFADPARQIKNTAEDTEFSVQTSLLANKCSAKAQESCHIICRTPA